MKRILFLFLLSAMPVFALDGARLYETVDQAAVEVYLNGRMEGSGWIASPTGAVITAAHVLWNRTGVVEVVSREVGRVEAKIVAFDRGNDLALLRIAPGKKPYPFLKVADEKPEPLTEIYLFGAPIFRHRTLSCGRVAQPEPGFEYYADLSCSVRCIHVDAFSAKGFSGGCWVDARGRVVGNQSGMMTLGSAPQGLAFMVPPDAILRLLKTATAPVTADAGVIVEELSEQPMDFIAKWPRGTGALMLFGVVKNGAAENAGLKAKDLIASVDGREIVTRDAFHSYIRTKKPGDEVSFSVLSTNGAPKTVTFKLDAL